jgi:hypothetical protein
MTARRPLRPRQLPVGAGVTRFCNGAMSRSEPRNSTPEEADMGVFNGVFPIQAGKEEDARAFAAETIGARRAGYEAHLERAGITRETWALQETPMGGLMVVWFEGDVEKAFVDLATDDSEYMAWFRGQVLSVTGVDLTAPSDAPPPAVLVDYRA